MSLHPDAGYDPRERYSQAESSRPRRARYRVPMVAGGLLLLVSATVWYASGSGVGGDGPVPLIQADPSPVKTRPEQPGGMAVPHQDKLIFQRLNPGKAGPVVERLLPGPETPLPRPEPPPDVVELEAPTAVPVVPPLVPAPLPQSESAVAAEGADAVPPETAPAAEEVPVAAAKAPPAEPPQVEPAPPEPAARPAAPPAPQQAASGKGVRLQIASVRSEDVARSEFQRLQRRFPEALGSLGLTVVRTDIAGKGTYYRVQAGPVDESRANAICQTLKVQSVGCLIVRP